MAPSTTNSPPDCDIALVGAYGVGNLGDDLLMCAALDALWGLCAPERIAVLCSAESDYVRRWYPDVVFRRNPGPYGRPVTAGVLVHGGGTQFFSFPTSGTGGQRASAVQRVAAGAVRAMRRPGSALRRLRTPPDAPTAVQFGSAAAFSVGVGPFVPGSVDEARARRVLSACGHVSVRDAASLECCRSWGIETAVLRADPCYGTRLARRLSGARGPTDGDGPDVLVVVRDWPHTASGAAYFEPLLAAVRKLGRDGLRVEFCAFAAAPDRAILRRLEREGESVLTWSPARWSVEEFAGRIAGSRLIVSARAHGAMLSAVLGIPAICIEVEPKLQLVAEQLGNGAGLWRQPFEPNDLARLVAQKLEDDVAARAELESRTEDLCRLADEAERELAQFVKDRNAAC